MESAGEYDYVIVGAGTAGCLLANRLTRRPATRVLLIEAGGKDDHLWSHIPAGYLYCIHHPRTDWLFRTEREPGLGGRALLYSRVNVLGGSCSINGMIYMRGQAGDYGRRADLTGDPSWRRQHVLPLFKRSEDQQLGPSAQPRMVYRISGTFAQHQRRVLGRQDAHHDFPPGRHLPHGRRRRSAGGARQPPACERRGRVAGADASVMPWITSGNTNAPTLTIAEKAAQPIHDAH